LRSITRVTGAISSTIIMELVSATTIQVRLSALSEISGIYPSLERLRFIDVELA